MPQPTPQLQKLSFTDDVSGIEAGDDNDDTLEVAGSADIAGTTDANFTAKASSVNTAADATADIGDDHTDDVNGVDLNGRLDVEGDASVVGNASVDSDVEADTTTGDASASASVEAMQGIEYFDVDGC